jgi:hypothetical protein
MTVTEFAAAAGVNQRYLREWLSHQASGGFELPLLRSVDPKIRAAAGAGDGLRDRGQPGLHDGSV